VARDSVGVRDGHVQDRGTEEPRMVRQSWMLDWVDEGFLEKRKMREVRKEVLYAAPRTVGRREGSTKMKVQVVLRIWYAVSEGYEFLD